MSVASERPARGAIRPMAGVAVAMIVGTLMDRLGPGWPTAAWGGLAMATGLVGAIANARNAARLATASLFVTVVALGGAWHHHRWSDLAPGHLARQDFATGAIVQVRGVLVEVPTVRLVGPRHEARTHAVLDVTAIQDGRDWRDASGLVELAIPGDRGDLAMGEAIAATGTLRFIDGPLNPGEFDRRAWLRAEGIRLRLEAAGPRSLLADPDRPGRAGARFLGNARERARMRLEAGLDPEVAPLASALLLGRREGLDTEESDAFARTGTLHLLAISGLHLQALALVLWRGFRLLGRSRQTAYLGVALAILGYGTLVGWVPSVARSAAMTLAGCAAGWWWRECRVADSLAMAALATLGWNPSSLFDVGCQLSFVGVAAVVWVVPSVERALGPTIARPFSPFGPLVPIPAALGSLDAVERFYEPRSQKAIRWVAAWALRGIAGSAAIWGITTPLVAWAFHVVPTVGILLNVPLIPLTTLALIAAALAMLPGPFGMAASWACSVLLEATRWFVRSGDALPGAFFYVPAPPTAWVVLFYATAAAWILRPRRRRLFGALLLLETVGLLIATVLPTHLDAPEADVLAVGHGLAVIFQGENGHVALYDCGKMGDPKVGRRIVAPALWQRGIRKVDSVFLSHADSDHFNGLADLLDRFEIGVVYVPPGFDGPGNPDALALLDRVRNRGVPIEIAKSGDSWNLGELTFRAIHPPEGWSESAPDNARSLVLIAEARGRRLLLTGDLEGPGLDRVIGLDDGGPFHAVIAPHHGGRTANPRRFYDWANAGATLISVSEGHANAGLTKILPEDLVALWTYQTGAIRLDWSREDLIAATFLAATPRPMFPLGWVFWPMLAGILLSALIFAAGFWLVDRIAQLLIQPRPPKEPLPDDSPGWFPVSATAVDGTTLTASWREAEGSPRGTVVLLHGIGETGAALTDRGEAVARLGWDVLRPDSRGFGRSGGLHATHGGLESTDVSAWLDAMPRTSGPVVLWGRSMGAAIALRTSARDLRVDALILEASYADLAETVAASLRRRRLPGWLAGPIVRRADRATGTSVARPSPVELGTTITQPVLILHGEDDPLVPITEARRLASAFAETPVFIAVATARHADVFDVGGPSLLAEIARFLDARTRTTL